MYKYVPGSIYVIKYQKYPEIPDFGVENWDLLYQRGGYYYQPERERGIDILSNRGYYFKVGAKHPGHLVFSWTGPP